MDNHLKVVVANSLQIFLILLVISGYIFDNNLTKMEETVFEIFVVIQFLTNFRQKKNRGQNTKNFLLILYVFMQNFIKTSS